MKLPKLSIFILALILSFSLGYKLNEKVEKPQINVIKALEPQCDTLYLEKELWYQNEALSMCQELVTPANNVDIQNVLVGDLEGTEHVFLDSFSSPEIAKAVMAVAVAESSGGLHACGQWNYWGIMLNGRCADFKDLDDAINGIKMYTGKYYREITELGINEENLRHVFIGQGKYCTSSCDYWVDNFLNAYYSL